MAISETIIIVKGFSGGFTIPLLPHEFIEVPSLPIVICYFNTSSLLPQLQTCFGVLSSLIEIVKMSVYFLQCMHVQGVMTTH